MFLCLRGCPQSERQLSHVQEMQVEHDDTIEHVLCLLLGHKDLNVCYTIDVSRTYDFKVSKGKDSNGGCASTYE